MSESPRQIHHLLVTVGGVVTTVRVAIQGFVQRGIGIWPSTVTVSLCEPEAQSIPVTDNDYSQIERIDLRLGLDTASVLVEDWTLIDVRETQHGSTPDELARRPVEWVWTLEDGRRRLNGRTGGMLFQGVLNRLRPSGAIITPKAKCSDLVQYCIDAIKTLTYREGPSLPAGLVTSLDAFEPPVELIWRGAHAPTELQRLLEWTRHCFAFNQDGTYSIHRLKDPGEALVSPTMGEARLPGGSVTFGDEAPTKCIISGAPTRHLIERKRTLDTPNPLTWVGVDVDGSIQPLEDLSWWPSGKTPIQVYVRNFEDVDNKYKNLARASVFRMLQLHDDDLTAGWTLVSRLLDEQTDVLERGIPLAVRLKAKAAVQNDAARWVQQTELVPISDVSIDLERGVIKCGQALIKLDASEHVQNVIGAAALGTGDLELTFCHHPNAGDETDYYMGVFEWDAGTEAVVQVTAGDPVGDALDEGVPIYTFPDLQVNYLEQAHPSTAIDPVNDATIDAIALRYAESIISTGSPELRIEQYPLLHDVDPDGSVSAILWDGNALATTVRLGNFLQITSDYIQRLALDRITSGGAIGSPRGGVGGSGGGAARGSIAPPASGALGPSTGKRETTGLAVHALPASPPALQTPFWAKITASTGPTDNTWVYDFIQVRKIGTGFGWTEWEEGSFTGTARNLFELNNDAVGADYLGIGITNDELDDTANSGACAMDLRPVPDDVIVLMWPMPVYQPFSDVVIEYWFQWANGVYEESA